MIQIKEIYWIAAFLEGEGCFQNYKKSPTASAVQVQKWPLEKLKNLLHGNIYLQAKPKNPKWSRKFTWVLRHSKGIALMMTIYPLMSPKRKCQILKVINLWKSIPPLPKYRTHCPKGHPYSPTKIKWRNTTQRICKICRRNSNQQYKKRHQTIKKIPSKFQLNFMF